MSILAQEAVKKIEALDDKNIQIVIRYIDTLARPQRQKPKRIFGLGKGEIPDISLEDLNSCNYDIRKIFENEEI